MEVYMCRACCEKEQIEDAFEVDNNIGRKWCHKCDDNDQDMYLVEYDEELGVYRR